jgi:hypothetical protein
VDSGIVLTVLPTGLGNQLFQYSAGFSLSRKWGLPLELDTSMIATQGVGDPRAGRRTYQLNHFAISARPAEPATIRYFEDSSLTARVRRYVDYVRSGRTPATVGDHDRERRVHSVFSSPRIRSRLRMMGFWECATYARLGGDELRRELELREPPSAENAEWIARIQAAPSVGVHVRGADLLHNPKQAGKRVVQGAEYYDAAAAKIEAHTPEATFYVFTDDPEHARRVVRFPQPTVFVEHNGEEHQQEDLRLLSCCRHHILSSSTFGWWGAWLGKREHQHVIAPADYFTEGHAPLGDYYPAEWELLGAP